MKKPDFRPLGNRYLILPDPIEGESETIGDVTLSKPKDPNKQAEEGTVIARGKSCGDVEVGAKVYYGKYSGYDRQIDGVDYKILQENELLGEHFVTPLEYLGQCLGCGCVLPTGINCCKDCNPENPSATHKIF
jgi:co-chaperonin GroES (HSP10)